MKDCIRPLGITSRLQCLFIFLTYCCSIVRADNPTTGMVPPPLNSGPSMAAVNSTYFRYDSVTPPIAFSWTSTNYITPVLMQFSCSSCWTLAATDAVSMMWAIANRLYSPILGSPQQTCDCATKQCCQGGWPEWVFAYITFNGGLNSWNNYTYKAADYSTCSSALANVSSIQATGWEYVPSYRPSLLMKAVSKQPVVVLIAADNDFFIYKSGVYDGSCSSNLNHAVVVVGFNQLANYWIIKNSWGVTWGEAGYMRIAMYTGAGKCGMHSAPGVYPVYYPTGPQPVKFANLKSPVKPRDSDSSSNNRYNGKWWTSTTFSSFFQFLFNDACSGVINPCGGGICYTSYGAARCICPFGYVEKTGSPTSKCVTSSPCASTFNPCGSGTCSNLPDGSYSCACPKGYTIGSRADGGSTCVSGGVLGGYKTYTTIPGDTCSSVALLLYNSTDTTTLLANNPFLNCSSAYISPGLALVASTAVNGTSCSKNYVVQSGDTTSALASYFSLSQSALNNINYADTSALLPGQTICAATHTIMSTDSPAQCSQTYNTTTGDTCSTVVQKNLLPGILTSVNDLISLNPGLSCSGSYLPYAVSICVSNASTTNPIVCTQWYTVLHGDTCPSIWNAANLTMAAFLTINPGIQCQAPYFQVGTSLCIASPQATPFLDTLSGSFPYTVLVTDTFSFLYSQFSARCSGASTQNAICVMNNISPCTDDALNSLANTTIIIPCARRVGDSCYCSPSVGYCGSDFVSYNGYCDSNCNYATPGIQMPNGCDPCRAMCSNRPGLPPNFPNSYSSYTSTCNIYWDGGPGAYVCRYPTWPPTNADWVVGTPSWGPLRQNCTFYNNLCKDLCTQVTNSRQSAGSLNSANTDFMVCYTNCYTNVPSNACNGVYSKTSSVPCTNYPGLCSCTCNSIATCC